MTEGTRHSSLRLPSELWNKLEADAISRETDRTKVIIDILSKAYEVSSPTSEDHGSESRVENEVASDPSSEARSDEFRRRLIETQALLMQIAAAHFGEKAAKELIAAAKADAAAILGKPEI